MPSLRHCRAPKRPARPIEYILAEIADDRGFIDKDKVKSTLLNTPGFSLTPGATYENVLDYLKEHGKIEYYGDRIYIPQSTRMEVYRQKHKR